MSASRISPFFSRDIGSIIQAESGKTISGRELSELALARAQAFLADGLRHRDHALLLGHNDWRFFVDLFGLWSLGVCAVVADPALSSKEIRKLKRHSGAKWIIDPSKSWRDASTLRTATSPDIDDPALLLYTSGTTGQPKGVIHTFRTLQARMRALDRTIPIEHSRRTLCVLPTHFGHGLISNCLVPLWRGCTLIIASASGGPLALRLGELIDRHGISFVSTVPSLWSIALRTPRPRRKTLRRVHIASASLDESLWRSIRSWAGSAQIWNVYGMLEAAGWIAGASKDPLKGRGGSCVGKPWGVRLRVSPSGEIWVKAASLTPGFHRAPKLNRAKFRRGWYRTGDLGFFDASGLLHIQGRTDHRINRGGIKVQVEEVERELLASPAIDQACVFPVPDPVEGETVGAALVLRSRAPEAEERIRRWSRSHLAESHVPDRWFFLVDLPKTARGKLDRRQIVELCLKRGFQKKSSAPGF